MDVNWHEPTPLSRFLSIVLFVGIIPALCFYVGTQYEAVQHAKDDIAVYEFPRLTSYTASVFTSVDATSTD